MERRWQVLIVVSVAAFMVSLDLFIVNIAFPAIRTDFHGASVSALSWVLNGYAIVFAALLVPAGRLADRFGRKRAFMGGLLTFLLGSALCGLAPSVETLTAARVLQGAGGAFLMPTSLALMLPEFPPAQRPAAIGIWAAIGGVAAASGPPIGGVLVELSWRWVFLVNLPIGALAVWFSMRILREARDESASRLPDLLGTLVLALSVAALTLGLVKAPDWGWGNDRTLGAIVGAVAGLVIFTLRCARHPSPVVDLAMLRVRSYAFANLAQLLFAAGFGAMLLGNVLFLTGVWHYAVLHAGVAIMPGPMLAATFAATTGRIAHRVGQRNLIAFGCALFACAALWWRLRLGGPRNYFTEFLPGGIMSGIGVGCVLANVASAAAASLPTARFATGSAVLTMSRQIGFALGVACLVAILGNPSPAHALAASKNGWTFIIVAALCASAAGYAIGDVRKHSAAAEVAEGLSPAPAIPVEAV